jgi:flagellin
MTVKGLDIGAENLQASESRIRDTDMANEMVKFTTSNVLSQAGTAMLAQANQSSQNVLSLLR